MENEVWKKVDGWPYEVSDFGRVRRCGRRSDGRRISCVVLKPKLREGYPGVTLKYGGRSRAVNVHTLVMEVFVGPTPAGREVHHLDHNRQNPKLENLSYVTHAENTQASHDSGLRKSILGEGNPSSKLSDDDVIKMREMRTAGALQEELSKIFSVSQSHVSNIVRRIRWPHLP